MAPPSDPPSDSSSSSVTAEKAKRRRRLQIGGGVVVVLLLLLWLLWRHSLVTPTVHLPEMQAAPGKPTRALLLRPGHALNHFQRYKRKPQAFLGPKPEVPIIDKIIVEKPEVCQGEENLVTVLAHTPGNRDDAYLHYTIGGKSGQSVPIRDYGTSRENLATKKRFIQVFGRNGVSTQAEVPFYRVKKCKVGYQVLLNRRGVMNEEDAFEFWAKVRAVDPKWPFKPAYYLWDFGDGTPVEKTTEPIVTHDFRRRSQKTYFTQLVVKCTAVGTKGRQVMGRMAFQMMNPHFMNFYFKGLVMLFFRFDPRFPEADESGVVGQRVLVYHHWDDEIIVDKIVRTYRYKAGGGSSAPENVSVNGLLGTNRIPPEGVEFDGELDTEAHPTVFSVDYDLYGHTPEGHPVNGVFSMMCPVKRPTRDDHIPVTDPVLKAKILKTRELLGKKFVTDEDIYRLERLGAFKDLVVDRSKPVKTLLPPPPLPKDRGTPPATNSGRPDIPPAGGEGR